MYVKQLPTTSNRSPQPPTGAQKAIVLRTLGVQVVTTSHEPPSTAFVSRRPSEIRRAAEPRQHLPRGARKAMKLGAIRAFAGGLTVGASEITLRRFVTLRLYIGNIEP